MALQVTPLSGIAPPSADIQMQEVAPVRLYPVKRLREAVKTAEKHASNCMRALFRQSVKSFLGMSCHIFENMVLSSWTSNLKTQHHIFMMSAIPG